MSYEGKNVTVDDTTVTIRAESAATARELAADAERGLIGSEGSKGQKAAIRVDGSIRWWGRIVDTVGIRSIHAVSWVAMIIGCFFAWTAGQNVSGIKGAGILFSIFLVALVCITKFSGGRWGKASRRKAPDLSAWRAVALIGLSVSALFGLALQAGVAVNQETGKSAVEAELRSVKGDIARLQTDIDRAQSDLAFPAQSAEALQLRFDGILVRDPGNARGEPSGRSLGEWAEHGTDNFCRGTSYYKTTLPYCEQLLELQELIAIREAYELDRSNLLGLRERETELLNERSDMRVSGSNALGQAMGGGLGEGWLATLLLLLPGVLAVLLVDGLAVGAAWLAYRYPNGVEGNDV